MKRAMEISPQKNVDSVTRVENAIEIFQEKRLTSLINGIIELKKKQHLSPETNRYVDRRVREALGLVVAKRPKKLPAYLTPLEIEHFLVSAQTISSKHRLLVEMLILTGLRINELRNVDIRDFHDNNQLFVRYGKGSKERYVPITSNLRHKIRLYVFERDRGYLFLNRSGRQYSVRMLQHLVGEVIEASGFDKHLSTHSLRHTFACLCMAKGLTLEEIQLLMGHSSKKTTEIYARLELGAVKERYLDLVGGDDWV